MLELTDDINQMTLTSVFRTFHPNTKQCTFFSASHGILPKLTHTQTQSKSNRKKKIEITPCILSDHCGLKLAINKKQKQQQQKNWDYKSMEIELTIERKNGERMKLKIFWN